MVTSAESTPTSGLREMLAVVAHRKWIILLAAALTLASALYFGYRQTPRYKAEGRLLVRPIATNSAAPPSPVNLFTESELLASEPVGLRVIDELDLERSVENLLEDVEAAPSTATGDVLNVTYVASDASIAADVVNSFLTNYLEYRQDRAREAVAQAEESIENRLGTLQDQLTTLAGEIEDARRAGDENLANTLEAQRSSFIARVGLLQQRLDDLEFGDPFGGGEVIDVAEAPPHPYSPNYLRLGGVGLLLGLAMGVGLAFLLERFADRLRDRADIERAVSAAVVGVIPRFRAEPKGDRPRPVLIREPQAPASEAFRNLRTSVDFLLGENSATSLLITSPLAAEGKTLTTVNLAVAMAESGKRVILLSADLRRPRLEHFFPGQAGAGLSTWLSGDTEALHTLIRRTDLPNIAVMGSGPVPQNPAQLLASPRLQSLFDVLERNCDVLLVDSPPVLAVTDAAILAARADCCLLVVDASKSRRSAAVRAAEDLATLNVRMLGVVLNAFAPDGASYAANYQSYTTSDDRRTSRGRFRSVFSRRDVV